MTFDAQSLIIQVCDELAEMLLTKNRKYGNSALDPVSIFFRGDAESALRVRIDDKLSRLANQQPDEDEDVIEDLLGYLVLYKVLKKMKNAKEAKNQKYEDMASQLSVPGDIPHTIHNVNDINGNFRVIGTYEEDGTQLNLFEEID